MVQYGLFFQLVNFTKIEKGLKLYWPMFDHEAVENPPTDCVKLQYLHYRSLVGRFLMREDNSSLLLEGMHFKCPCSSQLAHQNQLSYFCSCGSSITSAFFDLQHGSQSANS